MINRTIFAMVLTSILLISTAYALNVWMSNSLIWDSYEVSAGYRGYLTHNDWNHKVKFGTFDNETYNLNFEITGNASRFFKRYRKRTRVSNGNPYIYELYLNIPRNTAGNYTFNICGGVISYDFGFPVTLRLCTGEKILVIGRR